MVSIVIKIIITVIVGIIISIICSIISISITISKNSPASFLGHWQVQSPCTLRSLAQAKVS